MFARAFNDRELDIVVNLLNALQKEKVSSEPDKISWNRGKGDSFSVKKAYRTPQPEVLRPSLSRVFGFRVFQPKQLFYLGSSLGFLILDNLQRRGWQLPNRCYLCENVEETVHHILLHCHIARILWDLSPSLLSIQWVLPKTVKEALVSWRGPLLGKERKKTWNSGPLCIFGQFGRSRTV